MKTETHFNVAEGAQITAPYSGNQITENYYWFLVGEINRGTIKKAVCRIENKTFDTVYYYLISY